MRMMRLPERSRPPRTRARYRPALVAVVAAQLSACYEYVRPSDSGPQPGTPVRVALTDAGSVAVASAVGPRVENIEGRLTMVSPDTVVLSATETTQFGGSESTWAGERVAVPRSAVASLTVRRLSTSRTVLMTAAGVAAVAALIIGFNVGSPGNGANVHQVPTPK